MEFPVVMLMRMVAAISCGTATMARPATDLATATGEFSSREPMNCSSSIHSGRSRVPATSTRWARRHHLAQQREGRIKLFDVDPAQTGSIRRELEVRELL